MNKHITTNNQEDTKLFRKTVFLLLLVTMLSATAVFAGESAEEAFQKAFPQIKPDSVAETHIKGIYEIVFGGGMRIVYFHPESGSIIVGSIQTKDKNYTEERAQELQKKSLDKMKAKVKDIPLDKAVKIGSGKKKVIEFTDPDCPFCRKAEEYLRSRSDVTRYVFLFPLKQLHPQAEEKAKYVLCAKDKAKAMEEVMTGAMDNKPLDVCKDKSVEELLAEHVKAGNDMGVTGTPLLVVEGEVVQGANVPKIEELIGKSGDSKPSGEKADKAHGEKAPEKAPAEKEKAPK